MNKKEKSIRILKLLLLANILRIPLAFIKRAIEIKIHSPLFTGISSSLIITINIIVILIAVITAFAED
ncbi:hypothetical protein HKO22_02160 [Peptoniphilus sp. AGMB00490]|uniref:Uncharacterized protein n=1 Tax=Peptoniphilus faecalis TaxID=2731255 RepID=A0A848R5N6_9FIRM|nr:hypothetical protein [Peptoniphilus faecalis]MDD7353182.1 hypothetical protein [Peptoniphilaceae bacterium]NMW84547.1 hypothetical protein [Peptoniphilus faecalis]